MILVRLRQIDLSLMMRRAFGFCLIVLLSGCQHPLVSIPEILGREYYSSPLQLSNDGAYLWVANPDANTVTRVSTVTAKADAPIAVGQEPWGVAIAPSGLVLIMNRGSGSISFIENGIVRSELEVGPEPGGMVLSPTGTYAYITLSITDEVAVVNVKERLIVKKIKVGGLPWAIAITNDGDDQDNDETIVVTHRLARFHNLPTATDILNKEGWITLIHNDKVSKEVVLTPFDFGFVNALESISIVGNQAFITHLLNSPDEPRDFKSTVSGGISTISLSQLNEVKEKRIETNEPTFSTPVNFPRAIAITRDASKAYVVLAGTNAVMGISLSDPSKPKLIGFWPTGDNPRGIVLSADDSTAYVMNYLSRDISILDLDDIISKPEIFRIQTTPETLEPSVLLGKKLFNNANDPRLSNLGWMSCASCHLDGGGDGTSWQTPEGLRQTMPLWSLEGTAPFHASATRDEIQDFELDIEKFMDGVGLAPGAASPLLGFPNEGTSQDLNALSVFLLKGFRIPRAAPIDDQDLFDNGREVFQELNCSSCHSGPHWTNSQLPGKPGTLASNGEVEVESVLRHVGTFNPKTDVLGISGFDIPTLLGLHLTAPYLHDGSALSLEHVLQNENHIGRVLETEEKEAIIYFLDRIDNTTIPID